VTSPSHRLGTAHSGKVVNVKHRNDQKVVIAYPHPGTVSARFMRCLLDVWRYDALGGRLGDGTRIGGRRHVLDGGGLIERSTALLVRARTDIVTDFLGLEADWLLMLDSDVTFPPDLVDRLLAAAHPEARPIVSGLYFQVMIDQPRWFWPLSFMWEPGTDRFARVTEYPADTLIQVAATGAGCLLVHRSVLEAMQAKYKGPRPWFAETLNAAGDDVISEDLTFCLRAQACGFPVFLHTGIKLGHVKTFEADEAAFIAEAMGLAETAAAASAPVGA
jgi:hypothetical protein